MDAATLQKQAEEHLAKLEADYAPLQEAYDKVQAQVEPYLVSLAEIEKAMDGKKPALHEARRLVGKLKA